MNNDLIEIVRATFPPFVEFPSIPRLFREVVVTEKIDGTNASVHVTEDGQVWAASRTRYITPETDNHGFAKWVLAHQDELREGLGAGQHFGEWYGSGIQRGYGLVNGEKRFALFNSGRWVTSWRDSTRAPLGEKQSYAPECCEVVPVLATLDVLNTDKILAVATNLIEHGSQAVPGFSRPEGIVVYHTKSKQSYKYTFEKNDGHKNI